MEVLGAPRNVHGPRRVTEVATQLARDRRHGESGERDALLGVESLDGLDQAEQGDLGQVVEGLAPRGEPPGAGLGDRLVVDDELVA